MPVGTIEHARYVWNGYWSGNWTPNIGVWLFDENGGWVGSGSAAFYTQDAGHNSVFANDDIEAMWMPANVSQNYEVVVILFEHTGFGGRWEDWYEWDMWDDGAGGRYVKFYDGGYGDFWYWNTSSVLVLYWVDTSYWVSDWQYETQYDYKFDFRTKAHDIYDKRLQLSYQWTSQSHDIFDQRARYETFDTDTKVVTAKTLVQYQTVADTEQQTILPPNASSTPRRPGLGAFEQESILATQNLSIRAGAISSERDCEGAAWNPQR